MDAPRVAARCLLVATFVLITSGGAVTSFDAGMSVPDWPTSFGRWLVIPVHVWFDLAVFLEHNHRLTGALAGLMAIGTLWLHARGLGWRSGRTKLAMAVLVAFIVQGVMGGLRVTEVSRVLAIVHGVFGQVVLAAVVWLAVWRSGRVSGLSGLVLGVLLVQLVLGAVVRHTGSASAIPDAPTAYGGVFPPLDQARIGATFAEHGGDRWFRYAQEPALPLEAVEGSQRPALLATTPREPVPEPRVWQVAVHMGHRVGAVAVTLVLAGWMVQLSRDRARARTLAGPMLLVMGLLTVQILLGLSVIWSREHPWYATGHQAVGAGLLAAVVWLGVGASKVAESKVESHKSKSR